MQINFQCRRCRTEFDGEVGDIHFDPGASKPRFEKPIVCPKCGPRTMNQVSLTAYGQSQLTEALLNR